MTVNFLSVFTLLLSLLVIGEATALAIGTYVMRKGKAWLSIKNDLFVISDIAAGIAILCLAIIEASLHRSALFYVFVVIALATHTYRDWEYLADRNNPFCDNIPLLIVNNFKLAGIAVILIYSLIKLW